MNAASFKTEAEGVVDGAIAAGKFTPASRDGCIALCATQEGLDSFKKIVEVTPAIVDGKVQAPAAPPPPAADVSRNSEEAEFAQAGGYTEEQWKKIKEAGK
jgi:phage I-like protein